MTPQRFSEIFSRLFPQSLEEATQKGAPLWWEPYPEGTKELWSSDKELLLAASEVLSEACLEE